MSCTYRYYRNHRNSIHMSEANNEEHIGYRG